MLKANVGLSRKLSKDFNSTGFTINLEGEINAALDDPESVIERIRELYDLADEALGRQISESREIDDIARREADPSPANKRPHDAPSAQGRDCQPARDVHEEGNPPPGEPASNKQVQYLLTLAKRHKLQMAGLEARIGEVIGRRCTPYDLTKKEAGSVIDALNPEEAGNNRARR